MLYSGGGRKNSGSITIKSQLFRGNHEGKSGDLFFQTGEGTDRSQSGSVHIKSGKTHDNDAGKIVIEGGSAVGAEGGAISMKSGNSKSGDGGAILLQTGSGGEIGSTSSGNMLLQTGITPTGSSGGVTLESGGSTGARRTLAFACRGWRCGKWG